MTGTIDDKILSIIKEDDVVKTIISLPPKYGKTYHAELEKYKRKGVYMIMIKKFLDLFFPRCHVYDYWGNYIKTKRVFILKHLMNRR